MFLLHGAPDENLRLKSYSATSRGGKSIIKIEVQVTNVRHLGFALQNLAEVEEGQKRKPQPKKAAGPLALPAPDHEGGA